MNESKGIKYAFLTALISGLSIYLNKFGVSVINPYIFAGLKNLMVVIFLIALILILKEWKQFRNLSKKQWGLLTLIGLVGGSVPFLLFFKGLSLTTASKGSFIHKTMFLYVAILAILFLKEKISKGLIIGILALLFGNILMLKIRPQALNIGDLMVFGATLLWAVEQIISKYTLRSISPLLVIFGRMFIGSLVIMGFWLTTGQFSLVFNVNSSQFTWTLVTALLLLGYVGTWYTGLKYVRVSVATAVLAIGGPITSLLALIFDHKFLGTQEILGVILIVLGAVLVIGIGKIIYGFKKLSKVFVKI